ncbi:hypothetical protein Pcinc_023742 [Petrolisthes cinctipes]|uniref:Endonuclease/exonuclease/phosphatase domain-containing protein n=1 Tax=Petrolisthes cinctipes TaxID=88211 RepID=A0AAE1FCB3_PETCI|nr:hypothetical protein Pcinc_023742 [Petrolisthes cinctipes]
MQVTGLGGRVLRRTNGLVFMAKASHLVGGNRLWSSLERDGLRQVQMPKTRHMMYIPRNNLIPARSQPKLPMTAPSVSHQGGREKWKNAGEIQTEEGHAFYYRGDENRHIHGVGFLVNKTIKNTLMGCQPVSSRLITIRLRAKPFNITVIQAYAPTKDYDDEYVEDFYSQIQDIINKTDNKDILIIQGDWNAKVGRDALEDWDEFIGPSCNDTTNERGLRLLEFASYNNMMLANTLAEHKASRRWTWHAPNGQHNQINYILVQRRHRTGINRPKTRTFPGADVGSDHDRVMLNFRVRLRIVNKPKNTRLRFNLEKLKDPRISEVFQATVDGKFAPLLQLDEDLEAITNNFNSVMTETANEVLGKSQRKSKPWVTDFILELCDKRRNQKKKKNTPEGRAEYRKTNKDIRREMKYAKQRWITKQCTDIEEKLAFNNTKKAFQLVKDLTKEKQAKVNSIKDKRGNSLTEEKEILERWTEYCSELYTHQSRGDPSVLNVEEPTNEDDYPILRDEVVATVDSLRSGKSAGVDNIPSELLKPGGESTIDMLTIICNKIWQTGEWPKPWTQSLIIVIPKKGNLQLCQNYRTISLISHASKVMLRIILDRLKPQAESIIAEEQAGFRKG